MFFSGGNMGLMNSDPGLVGPDKNLTHLMRYLPCVHKFESQLLKARIIQFEYPPKRAARDALLVVQQCSCQR